MSLIGKTFRDICKYAQPKRGRDYEGYAVFCKSCHGTDAPDLKMFRKRDKKGIICIESFFYFSKCSERWKILGSPWRMHKCPYRSS